MSDRFPHIDGVDPELPMLIGTYSDATTNWLENRVNPSNVRPIKELTAPALTGCNCLLVNIQSGQRKILQTLAELKPCLPIVVVVNTDHDFSSGYPYGCPVQEILSDNEIGSSLFWQRIRQAIAAFCAPLRLQSVRSPLYSFLHPIVDNSSDWIIVKDLDHRFLLASDSFVQQTGLTRDELIGKNDLEIGSTPEEVFGNSDTGWAGFWPQDDAVMSSGEMSIELNPTWTAFSEKPRYKRTLRIPLKNAYGQVYGLLVCSHDITEQKKNELMLRERTEMLALVTAEKKRSEEHRQLAEQAVSARNKFIAAASHDLRQPLHAMGLFLDVLESRLAGGDNHALMHKVKQCCASLSSLFNSLLDISQLDAGAVEKDCENISSKRLLASFREEFRQQAAVKQLDYIDNADNSNLNSDVILLSRIIRNLVNNAIENTSTGCITVTCQKSLDSVLLSVGDTGRGIPEQEQSLIFTEFHQVDSQVAERGKGVGLGLAIVKRLCDLLDIDISLQSTTGSGSCFMLRIPPGSNAATEHETPMMEPASLAGVHVVVIDDEAIVREAMEMLLQSHDCITHTAANAAGAIKLLDKSGRAPDVIVADYQLSNELTGEDAIKTIRARFGAEIPALLVTGDTASVSAQSLLRRGLPTIHKPVEMRVLINTISEVLERQLDSQQ